jgi:Ran GTPase-activating protein (RanGAP) involved in mRNA processing and transport
MLLESIVQNQDLPLIRLELNELLLGEEEMLLVSQLVRSDCSALRVLRLTDCSISGNPDSLFLNAFKDNTHLEVSDLSRNPLGSRGAMQFSSALRPSSNLRVLKSDHTGMSTEGLHELVKQLRGLVTLRVINLSGNPFGNVDQPVAENSSAIAISSLIRHHRGLRGVDISNCQLSDQDAAVLAEGLQDRQGVLHTFSAMNNHWGGESRRILRMAGEVSCPRAIQVFVFKI